MADEATCSAAELLEARDAAQFCLRLSAVYRSGPPSWLNEENHGQWLEELGGVQRKAWGASARMTNALPQRVRDAIRAAWEGDVVESSLRGEPVVRFTAHELAYDLVLALLFADVDHSVRPGVTVPELLDELGPFTLADCRRLEWRVEQEYRAAVRALGNSKGPAPRNPDRDKWIYEQKKSGVKHTVILVRLQRDHPDWEPLEEENAITKVVKRYCERTGEPRP